METYEISENVWNTTCITDKYNFGSETKLCNISLEESSKLSENKTATTKTWTVRESRIYWLEEPSWL